jgi:hypothetical protein
MADVTGTFYPSNAAIGYTAEFLVGQGEATLDTFVAVPEVMSISPIVSMTTGTVDVTHLRSPDRHREKAPTISDSGPIVISGNYDPSHGAHMLAGGDGFDEAHNLQALRASCARNNFKIRLPEVWAEGGPPAVAIELPLVGFISKYEIGELSLEGKVPFTLEVTPTHAYFSH